MTVVSRSLQLADKLFQLLLQLVWYWLTAAVRQ